MWGDWAALITIVVLWALYFVGIYIAYRAKKNGNY